jgi:predicted metal-dependent peptidase
MDIHNEIVKAKIDACRAWPRATFAITSLVPICSESVLVNDTPTMAVDRYYRLYYHPDVIKIERPELCWVMVHEVCHLIFKHFRRAEAIYGPMDSWSSDVHMAMNICADLAINSPLAMESKHSRLLRTPVNALLPEQFGLEPLHCMEYYLSRLPREESEKDGSGDGNGSGGEGTCLPGTKGHREANEKSEYSQPKPDDFDSEESDPVEGVTPGAESNIAHRVSKNIGNEGLDLLFKDSEDQQITEPEQDYFEHVINRITSLSRERGFDRRSYRRASRRSQHIILPTIWKATPETVLICDTSGSMSSVEKGKAKACVEYILKRWPSRSGITVVSGDTSCKAVTRRVRSSGEVELRGGGGTDMGKIIMSAVEQFRPGLIVCATDCYTPWCSDPGVPVIIASTTDGLDGPDWAETIHI